MNQINFEEQTFSRTGPSLPQRPRIINFIIKNSGGLIKDERVAGYVILGFIVVSVALSMFLILNMNQGVSVPEGELYYGGPESE